MKALLLVFLLNLAVAIPGQALRFTVGEMKFRELRAKAQLALGPRFDIRAFHSELLGDGAMPLDLLEAKLNRWIRTVQTAPWVPPAPAAAAPPTGS